MKKYFTLVLSLLLITACKKEALNPVEDPKPTYREIISNFTLPADANEEVTRIAEAIVNPDYTFGITDNPNYGKYSSSPEYDIYMSGSTPPSVGLKLDGNVINQANGQWLHQSIDYKQYFEKSVDIEITNNGVIEYSGSVYVPKPAITPLLSPDLHINRTGNTITWEVDQNYPANKIALAYSLHRTADLNNLTDEIDRGVLLIDNNGSFSIDQLLTNTEAHKVYFRLVSGNAVGVEINGEKVLFAIKTYDHHVYAIED